MTDLDRSPSHSWWWDSHQSPKHSQWLQNNMEELDQKVKIILQLIEAEADSFAQRAEMYYQRRPDLINLVEELYRAYRSLAERYDVLRGEIKQNIPKAMQAQYGLSCDSPRGTFSGRTYCRRERYGREPSLQRFGRMDNVGLEHSDDLDIVSSSDETKGIGFSQDSPSSSSDSEADNSTEVEKLQQALVRLGSEYKQLTFCWQGSVEENKKLEITVKMLQGETARSQEENLRLIEDLETGLETSPLGNRAQILEEDICQLKEENAKLSTEISARSLQLKEVKGQLAGMQEEKTVLREKMSDTIRQKNQLQREVERLQLEATKLTAATFDTLDWMRILENEVNALQVENERLKGDISAAVEQNEVAIAALRFVKDEYSNLIKRTKVFRDEILDNASDRILNDKDEQRLSLDEEEKDFRMQSGKVNDLNMKIGQAIFLVAKDQKQQLHSVDRILKDKDEQLLRLQEENKSLRNERLERCRMDEDRINGLSMKIKELHGQVDILGAENHKQQLILLDRAEEKKEAIRQLCFSIDFLQEKNRKLEKALYSARMQLHSFCNASSNQLTWRKFLLGSCSRHDVQLYA